MPSVKLEVQHGQVFLESTQHEGGVPLVLYLEQHVGMCICQWGVVNLHEAGDKGTELRRANDVTVGCADVNQV